LDPENLFESREAINPSVVNRTISQMNKINPTTAIEVAVDAVVEAVA
jgi:hypothetical protein